MKNRSLHIKIIFLLVCLFFPLILIQVISQTNDAVLLNYQTDLIVKNNKLYISRSYELQINNRRGEEYAEISIPHSKMNKVSKIEGYIKDKNGIIVKKLKSSDIVDRSTMADFSLYEDNFVKEFTLVYTIYPYSICFSYLEQQDAFFYIESWTPEIYRDIPTLSAMLNLEVPLDYEVAHTSQLIDSFKADTIEKQIRYCWKTSYLKPILPEIYAPNQRSMVPKVELVPLKFKYDKYGEQNNWTGYGNWEYNLIDGLGELPETEKHKIDQLLRNVNDDNEKVKVLYHYLQDETRYINISIKTGGMKPYPASYVAINKYGDCKALSNYFRSILSYVGIKSLYTNVHAGDEIKKIDQRIPSMQFNHVIVCVPLLKDTVWLDCTSDGAYNHLGTFTQNREVFLIDKDHSHFTKTPSLSKQDVLVTRNIEISSDLEKNPVASFRSRYKGENYEALLGLSNSVSETKKAKIIRNNLIESNLELIDYKIITINRDSSFIIFQYTAKAENVFKKYGTDELIGLIPFNIPTFKEPKIRKSPVQIDYPIYKLDTIKYQIQVDHTITSLPSNQNINSEFGTYDIQFKQIGNTVEVIKSFLLYPGNYSLQQYPDFYKFTLNVSEIENNSYIVIKNK